MTMEVEINFDLPVDTISERRRIREERQRSETEGYREDMADVCKCHCGNVHYVKRRPRTEAEANEKVKVSNE